MKQALLFIVLLGTVFTMSAQTFSDDFESYDVGAKIAASSANWTTWSGGGSDDAPITVDQAHSGTKSLKFKGVGSGGPSDVILPFLGKKTSGSFDLELYIFVKSGKSAYFNLQGETSPGSKWAEDFFFLSDGTLAGSKMPFVGSFPIAQWTKFGLKIDLDHNIWEVFIDDVYQGSYDNPLNTIASMDIYPTDSDSEFYIDDVTYVYDAATPVLGSVNASLDYLELRAKYLAGVPEAVQARLRNTGTETIASFDVSYNDGTNENTDSYTGLSIKTLDTYSFSLNGGVTNIPEGETVINVVISNVNGSVDEKEEDNAIIGKTVGVQPAPHRKVLFEEGTGTWCQWCPRGAVFMDLMAEWYPTHFVGIAVHSGDPMQVTGYPNGVGFSTYPSITTERAGITGITSMAQVEGNFYNKIISTTPAAVFSGATYDASSKVLSITAQADFLEDATQQYKLAVILTEDDVTGSGSGYVQKNAYAGGSNGVMGGFESLPSLVPASQMVYNHVGRKLVSPLSGAPNSLPNDAENGASYDFVMPNTTLSSNWELEKMHIVTLLINPSGKVVNANSQTIAEALEMVLANNEVEVALDFAEVYPNPFSQQTTIFLSLNEPSDVNILIYNSLGQFVATKKYGYLSGKTNLDFDVSQLNSGLYTIQIYTKNTMMTKRVVVK